MKKRDDKREEIGADGSKRIREERISIALRLAKEKRAQLDFWDSRVGKLFAG